MKGQTGEFIPTRYSLLSRLQDWDDQESWKDFFDTYWRLIYSFALKAGLTDAEAQDVVQETVMCVARDIDKFKRDRQLGRSKVGCGISPVGGSRTNCASAALTRWNPRPRRMGAPVCWNPARCPSQ